MAGKVENEWVYRAQRSRERFVTKPEDYDEPTCGPGPFSMGNADTTSGILVAAGFEQISLRRCDLPIQIGTDLDEAVARHEPWGRRGVSCDSPATAPRTCRAVAAALREGLAEPGRRRG